MSPSSKSSGDDLVVLLSVAWLPLQQLQYTILSGTKARTAVRQTLHARQTLAPFLLRFNGTRLCWPRHQITTSSYVKRQQGQEEEWLINMSDEPSSRPSLRLQSNIPLQYYPISASISLRESSGPGSIFSTAICS